MMQEIGFWRLLIAFMAGCVAATLGTVVAVFQRPHRWWPLLLGLLVAAGTYVVDLITEARDEL